MNPVTSAMGVREGEEGVLVREDSLAQAKQHSLSGNAQVTAILKLCWL